MKNTPTTKAVNLTNASPKTPGGISKTLLTPCRRLGLSRSWRKSGPSPFVSPLGGSSAERNSNVDISKTPQKRKLSDSEDNIIEGRKLEVKNVSTTSKPDIENADTTPLKHVATTTRKKSKTFLNSLQSKDDESPSIEATITNKLSDSEDVKIEGRKLEVNQACISSKPDVSNVDTTPITHIATTTRKKSKAFLNSLQTKDYELPSIEATTITNEVTKHDNSFEVTESVNLQNFHDNIDHEQIGSIQSNTKRSSSKTSISIETSETDTAKPKRSNTNKTKTVFKTPVKASKNNDGNNQVKDLIDVEEQKVKVSKLSLKKSSKTSVKAVSPNTLTKECIIVIERDVLKKNDKVSRKQKTLKNIDNVKSQVIFDSDDEKPLSHVSIHTNEDVIKTITTQTNESQNIDCEDDFEEDILSVSNKIKKLEDKKTSTTDLKARKKVKTEHKTKLTQMTNFCFDDDEDDFDTDNRRTILIKKTYTKVAKPSKAKSTGSVTQKDIDELRARIERKKELLLAKTMTKETKELRDLIKKWKKGCQEALAELIDLMQKKFPEKHNMDISELLEMLKIPPKLIGYDADYDYFKSPEEFPLSGYS